MKNLKHTSLALLSTLIMSTQSAVSDVLTEVQLHATLGVITNFILDDESKNFKPLKKTGQVNSYETDGLQVFDGSLKDDGFYQKGVTPNYSRNDGDEIVTDHITGLQWQDDVAVASVQKPWLEPIKYEQCTGTNGQTLDVSQCSVTAGDTATSYCLNLTLGGHTDWRLPAAKELVGLSVYGQLNPAIDATFQNTASSGYWSSTTRADRSYYAWLVSFNYGGQSYYNKNGNFYVRCVRVGQ